MILLDTTTRSLQVLLGGAKTTNDCPYTSSYIDIAQSGFAMTAANNSNGNTNGTTPVTLVGSPTGANTRQIKYLSLQNADTVNTVFEVQYNDNGNTYLMIKANLQVNETLEYNSENGWNSYTNTGALKIGGLPVGATYQNTTTSPTAPANTTSYKMQGLAGAITPKTTGNILIIIDGTIVTPAGTTVNNGIIYQISYGTGGAPSNGGVQTGTQIGLTQQYTSYVAPSNVADTHQPFCLQAVATGLTVDTAYWIDLASKSITTISDMGFSNVAITAVEF